MSENFINPNCSICKSRMISVFNKLEDSEAELIDTEKNCGIFKRGSVIFEEGKQPNGLYCIHHGKVKLYRSGKDGKEQIVRFSKNGGILGYRALISGESYTASAEALDLSSICFIPKATLFSILKKNNDFSLKMMQMLCQDLSSAEKRMVNIAQKSVREGLAETLLILIETFETTEDDFLDVKLSREDLANMIGTATESVIRALAGLKKDGIVELSGRKIKIINKQALMRESQFMD